MESFLSFSLLTLVFASYVPLNNYNGVPLPVKLPTGLMAFSNAGNTGVIDNQGKIVKEKALGISFRDNSRAILLNNNKILLVSVYDSISLYLYDLNIEGKLIQTIPFNTCSVDYFTLLNLSNNEILIATNCKGKISFFKGALKKDNAGEYSLVYSESSVTLDAEYPSTISCEELQYKGEPRILCVFPSASTGFLYTLSIYDINLQLISESLIDYDFSGSHIFVKLIKISETNFVVGFLDEKTFNFYYGTVKSNGVGTIINKQFMASIMQTKNCQKSHETTEIFSVGLNTFVLMCKEDNANKYNVLKLTAEDKMIAVERFSFNPKEEAKFPRFSKLGENSLSLFYQGSSSSVFHQIAGYIYCAETTASLVKGKVNKFNLAKYAQFSELFVSLDDIYTKFFSIPPEGILSFESSNVIANKEYQSLVFDFAAPDDDRTYTISYVTYTDIISVGKTKNEECTLKINFKPCFTSCKDCDEVGDTSDHKCSICPDNFGFLQGTKNCVNCKDSGSYKPITGRYCVSPLPSNSYVVDSQYNLIEYCDETCDKCDKDKCLQCKTGMELHPKVKTKCVVLCDTKKYNWYLDNDDEYRCTEDKTCEKTYNTHKKILLNDECVNQCPSNLYQYGKTCVSQCPDTMEADQKEKKCVFGKNIQKTSENVKNVMDVIKDEAVVNPNKTITFETDSMKFQVYSQGNFQANSSISAINFSACEKKLREHYTYILPEEPLFIATVDLVRESSTTNKVEYKVYDSNGKELDLSYCSEEPIEILYPINSNVDINLTVGEELGIQGIDIYNSRSDFFNDICYSFSQNGTDVLVSDRRTYFYTNVSFCESGCEYNGIDFYTKKVNCTCSTKQYINLTVNENEQEELKSENIFTSTLSSVNINVMKCYKSFFKPKNVVNNVGFWFSIVIFLANSALFCLFFGDYKIWKIKVAKVVECLETKRQVIPEVNARPSEGGPEDGPAPSPDSPIPSIEVGADPKNGPDAKPEDVPEDIPEINPEVNPDVALDIAPVSSVILPKPNPPNSSIEGQEIISKLTFDGAKFSNDFEKNKRCSAENYRRAYERKCQRKKSTGVSSTNGRVSFMSRVSLQNSSGVFFESLNFEGTIVEDLPIFKVKDIDNLPYELAYREDRRSCLAMFWKKIKDKQMLIRAIFVKSEFELITINLSVYVSYLGLYFTLNALFYTDSLISSRYKNGGSLGFFQNLLRSILSCLVSAVLFSFLKFSGYFSLAMETLIFEVKISKDFKRLSERLVKAVRIKLIIFFVVEFVFMMLFMYYLSCFCIVYHSTQWSWFRGGWTSFLISLCVCLGICVGFSSVRYVSLKNNSNGLYNAQLFINKLY